MVVLSGMAEASSRYFDTTQYRYLLEPVRLALAPGPHALSSALVREFPWMAAAVNAVTADLALQRRGSQPAFRVSPMLLVGPAGCGKDEVRPALGSIGCRTFGVFAAGGGSDARLLLGTARGWASSQPCLPVVLMAQCQCANPLVLVDDVDKSSQSERNGCVVDALLTFLERESARRHFEEALLGAADLSMVSCHAAIGHGHPLSAAPDTAAYWRTLRHRPAAAAGR
jgi:hypothetical protein